MQRIFAADIGGTNARFGIFFYDAASRKLCCDSIVWQPSESLRKTEDVFRVMGESLHQLPAKDDVVSIAIAGPVDGSGDGLRGQLTNGRLRLDMTDWREKFSLRACLLCNDFAAEAHAIPTEIGEKAACIMAGDAAPKNSVRAVLGAGTGLGAALLAHTPCPQFHSYSETDSKTGSETKRDTHWLALPSEVGHTPFAFVGAEETAFHDFLRHTLHVPCASAENVLCGRGLALLHSYLSGQELDPAGAAAAGLSQQTPTLQWYARFLARFCRQWILSTLCRGGLWITGGIAARNPLCVTTRIFYEELAAAPTMGEFLRSIPIRLVTDRTSGLWGAAQAGLASLLA